ncbi:GPR103 [Mytilus edulis]|uniref:QRFPR n=1 Tax=Mytilus edulis TaxID=6550 RepID=A0A8S3PR95_MYTED|nr:GPR103 [Mytilus edulis]
MSNYTPSEEELWEWLRNNTDPDDILPDDLEQNWKTALIITYSLIIIGGIIGNVLVVAVILLNKSMRSVTNVLLVSLAGSDTLIASWNIPIQLVYYVKNEWTMGETLCKGASYLQNVSVVASITTLMVVSIERYYAICHPLKARYIRTPQRAGILIALIWIFALTVSIPMLVIQRLEIRLKVEFVYIKLAHVCAEYYSEHVYDVVHTLFMFLVFYTVPMVVMFCAYGRIAYQLWIRKPIGDSLGSPQYLMNTRRQKRKIIRMLITVVVLFGLCWLPFFAIQLHHLENNIDKSFRSAQTIVHIVGYLNCVLNPIVYGFMNENFKQCLKSSILKCRGMFKTTKRPSVHTVSITVESAV